MEMKDLERGGEGRKKRKTLPFPPKTPGHQRSRQEKGGWGEKGFGREGGKKGRSTPTPTLY